MSAGTDWRGGNPDEPKKFGHKAEAWFRRRLLAELFTPVANDPDTFRLRKGRQVWGRDAVDKMLDWYIERRESYTVWIDSDKFHGASYSCGAWHFQGEAVQRDMREAIDHVDRLLDAEDYDTLDDWLRADIADKLWFRGERGGMLAVPKAVKARLRAAKLERELSAPKRCPCGASFTPTRRRAVHCPACLEVKAAERRARDAEFKRRWEAEHARRDDG